MKALFHLCVLLLGLSIFSTELSAQNESYLSVRAGLMAFRGETSKNADFLVEELGPEISVMYQYSLPNGRWRVFGEFSYGMTQAQRGIEIAPNVISDIYQTTSEHFFFGLGVRHFFNSDLRRYDVYQGQFLPFVGVSVGGVMFQNATNIELIEASGYIISEEMQGGFAVQGEAGLTYMLDDYWGLGVYFNLRPGFSDLWDGIDGLTIYNDYIFRSGLSLLYTF